MIKEFVGSEFDKCNFSVPASEILDEGILINPNSPYIWSNQYQKRYSLQLKPADISYQHDKNRNELSNCCFQCGYGGGTCSKIWNNWKDLRKQANEWIVDLWNYQCSSGSKGWIIRPILILEDLPLDKLQEPFAYQHLLHTPSKLYVTTCINWRIKTKLVGDNTCPKLLLWRICPNKITQALKISLFSGYFFNNKSKSNSVTTLPTGSIFCKLVIKFEIEVVPMLDHPQQMKFFH